MVSACLELGILLEDRSGTKEIGAVTLPPPRNPQKPEVHGLSEH